MPVQPAASSGQPAPSSSKPRPQTTPDPPPRSTSSCVPSNPTHIATLALQVLLCAMLVMGVLLSLLPAAGHDQLWFLLMARRWLAGATLYGPELFDSNTPAIIWLSAVPSFLGHTLHLPFLLVPALAKLLVLVANLLLALLCARLLRHLAPTLSRNALLWLASAYTLLTLCAPARDFGQRDALAAALLLPYLLTAAASARTLRPLSPARPLSALLAALGLCLKPHQALVPVAIELTLLVLTLHRRTASPLAPGASPHATRHTVVQHAEDRPLTLLHRPEPAILIASGLLFLAAVHHLTPLFFSLTLPTLLDTYWAVGGLSVPQLLAQSPQLTGLALVALLAPAAHLLTRQQPAPAAAQPQPSNARDAAQTLADLHRPILLFLVAGLAATLAFFLQDTGWYYQQLPAITFFGIALALTLIPLAFSLAPPRWLPGATAALAVLAITLTITFGGLPLRRATAYTTPVPEPTLFQSLPPHAPLAILTTSVEDSMMPTWRWDLTWAQRTNNLWTLPAILRNLDPLHPPPPRHRLSPTRLAALSAQQRRWMLEDLLRWHPTLILVQRCQDPAVSCQELGPLHPDLLGFFLADPAFRALFFAHYCPLRQTPNYAVFTLKAPW